GRVVDDVEIEGRLRAVRRQDGVDDVDERVAVDGQLHPARAADGGAGPEAGRGHVDDAVATEARLDEGTPLCVDEGAVPVRDVLDGGVVDHEVKHALGVDQVQHVLGRVVNAAVRDRRGPRDVDQVQVPEIVRDGGEG